MPKVIITEGCLVNYADDRGGVHEDQGAICEPSKDVAKQLVTIGRALYVSKADDFDKNGANTASPALLRAAEAAAKAAAQPPKQ
ncbi:MAG: hypothetical protein HZC22_13345 [Rhodocyclales bacterium]|nr:hypothetical protein [Rhodocyclales bacterium]